MPEASTTLRETLTMLNWFNPVSVGPKLYQHNPGHQRDFQIHSTWLRQIVNNLFAGKEPMKNFVKGCVRLVSFSLYLASAACSNVPDDTVVSSGSEIRNGDAVPPGYSEIALLNLDGSGCSGELITNSLVLTAKHCIFAWISFDERAAVDPATVFEPRRITATIGAQMQTADLVLWHPSLDVAVIHFEKPFSIAGSTKGYVRRVRASSVAVGDTLECYGYGNNIRDGRGMETGFGTLRHSSNTVSAVSSTQFSISNNARDQILLRGDSGGACFSGLEIAGVSSRGDLATTSSLVLGSAFRPWLDDLLGRFTDGNELADGFKVRDATGRIFVVMGNGALWIRSWDEYVRSWSMGPLFQTGPFGWSMVPRDGTILREPSGEIDVIYAGAHFHVSSMAEFYALGFSTASVRPAPTGSLASIGVVPRNGVALRDRGSGEIDVIIGGKRWWVASMATYMKSYSSWPIFSVPTGSLVPIPSGGVIP